MRNQDSLTVIIPIWNELGNIDRLSEKLMKYFSDDNVTFILLSNGSVDGSNEKILSISQKTPHKFTPLILSENLGYGGGVRRGLVDVHSDWACWIPADLQVRPRDLKKLWGEVKKLKNKMTLVKGKRVTREDSFINLVVSKIYTFMGRFFLGIKTSDINALPKIIPSTLIKALPLDMRKNFVFDAQVLYFASQAGLDINEYPVGWFRRHSGESSWQNKKIRTYLSCFIDLIKIKMERTPRGVREYKK